MRRVESRVARLDVQHEQLLKLLGEMRQALEDGRPAGELRRLSALLTLHTRMHFMDEETFMEGAEYPGLARHRVRHTQFTEGLLRFEKGLRTASQRDFREIVQYELQWIAQHLEEEDDELGGWVRENELRIAGVPTDGLELHSSIPIMPESCRLI
jgi:hemerythrin